MRDAPAQAKSFFDLGDEGADEFRLHSYVHRRSACGYYSATGFIPGNCYASGWRVPCRDKASKKCFRLDRWYRKKQQAVEQAIYAEVGKHLATLDLHQMRRQPIYALFEEDSTLDCFPA